MMRSNWHVFLKQRKIHEYIRLIRSSKHRILRKL